MSCPSSLWIRRSTLCNGPLILSLGLVGENEHQSVKVFQTGVSNGSGLVSERCRYLAGNSFAYIFFSEFLLKPFPSNRLQSHYDRQLRDAKKSEPKVVNVHEPPATQGEGAAASAKRGTIFESWQTCRVMTLGVGKCENEISWIMYRNELANWIWMNSVWLLADCGAWIVKGKQPLVSLKGSVTTKSPDSPIQNPQIHRSKIQNSKPNSHIVPVISEFAPGILGFHPPCLDATRWAVRDFPWFFPFEELGNTTFSTGRDALKAVAEPLGPWNWAFFTGGTELTVVAGGIGSVEEMRTCYEEHPEDAWYQWTMPWWNFSDFDKIGELYSKKNKPTVYVVFEPGLIWHDKSMYPKNE